MNKKLKSKKFYFALLLLLAIGYFLINKIIVSNNLMKLSKLDSSLYIENAIKNLKNDSIITVGIYKDGKEIINKYDKNGENKNISNKINYEIASITKTMTANIIYELVKIGKININETIDNYIRLEKGKYPTIKDLLTHTAGYKTHYMKNIFSIFNPFADFNKKDAINVINKNNNFKSNEFNYSNFGYSVLGLIIENIYNKPYVEVLNEFMKKNYLLESTKILSNDEKSKDGFFEWNDFYKPAGACISNIEDMLVYLEKNIQKFKNEESRFLPLYKGNTKLNLIKKFGIKFDAISYGWLIDTEKMFWAHPGELPNSSSFIGFNLEKNTCIVVLINQSISDEVNAKFLGAKMLNELTKN